MGYAGESAPRSVLRTPPELRDQGQGDLRRDGLYDRLVAFVHRIYFGHLLVNPKDRRVVLVDHLLGSIVAKEVLSEVGKVKRPKSKKVSWRKRDLFWQVLFKHYEVLSILYAPSSLMPLFTLGLRTRLVLDVGYAEVKEYVEPM